MECIISVLILGEHFHNYHLEFQEYSLWLAGLEITFLLPWQPQHLQTVTFIYSSAGLTYI